MLSWEVMVVEMKEHGNGCDRDWSKLVGFKEGPATYNSVRLGFRKWNGQLQFTPYLRSAGDINSGDRTKGFPVWDVEEGKTYMVNMVVDDRLIMEVVDVGVFEMDVIDYTNVTLTNLYLGGNCEGEVKAQICRL